MLIQKTRSLIVPMINDKNRVKAVAASTAAKIWIANLGFTRIPYYSN